MKRKVHGFGGVALIAHTATDAEKLEVPAAQFTVHIVLVVPAETAVLAFQIDKGVAEPTGKVGAIDP